MYTYVFDSFVQDQKFRNESARIETRLSSLGIQGRSDKITILKNLQESVKGLLKRNPETIVVVGNDQTLVKVLPLVINADVALGMIPIGQPTQIGEAFGIPNGVAACDILSRRIMRRIDVGVLGGAYFLLRADLPATARIQCDGTYTIQAEGQDMRATIQNVTADIPRSRPDDGRLELVIEKVGRSIFGRGSAERSVFPLTKAKIERGQLDDRITLDGQLVVNPPVTISVLKQKLHVIVGRGRAFE